jgi:hypothetical protein
VKKRVPIAEEAWFEKKFDFNHPVRAFPAVMERVRGTPARLEEMIRSFPDEILTQRVGDAWTIKEHIGHLYDLDELHDNRLDDYVAERDVLKAADLTNKKTYEANHNDRSLEDLLAQFRAARMAFVERLDEMDEEQVARSALHPRLQKQMRVVDLAIFVAEHDDHHLASIRRLAETLSNGST